MPQAAWDTLPDFAPPPPVAPADYPGGSNGIPSITVHPRSAYKNALDDLPDYEPKAPPSRNIGTGEAAVRGGIDAASFGLTPALQGLTEAGKATKEGQETESAMAGVPSEAPGMETSGVGLAKVLQDRFGNHPNPEAREAYERGRQQALDEQKSAQEQHPGAFLAGQFVGGMLTPGFGAATAGTLPARLATGAIAGGMGGGMYGAGEAVSEGKSAPEVMQSAGGGALLGAPTGAVLKGVIGPRVPRAPRTPVTAGQRAAATAEDLGAPLPRGLASDSPTIQATTAKLISTPFAGEKIRRAVGDVSEAAGDRVGEIAGQMTGGATDRAAGDVLVRPGLQQVIDDNHAAIDQAYGGVRGMIDQNARFTMPRTDATLNAIMRARAEAGHTNPAQGLEQFRNVAGGATFNGAHRARVDAREAGNVLVPHPGYNAADYNRLTRAMTEDLRAILRAAAKGDAYRAQRAVEAFNQAEHEFGKIAEQNDRLHGLLNSRGEGAIATLLGAMKEKGGDIRLLAQLRHSMDPQEFEQIGGTLLHELGHNAASGEFSLSQFVTNWNKTSDRAKGVLFQPQHLQNINDIVNLGEHIKGALKFANTSHTASTFIIYELIRDGVEGGIAVGAGYLDPTAGAGALAGFAVANLFTRYLASPARASSMAAWSRAYNAAAQRPTPVRIATFKLATRNMANNLGLDPAQVMRRVDGYISGN